MFMGRGRGDEDLVDCTASGLPRRAISAVSPARNDLRAPLKPRGSARDPNHAPDVGAPPLAARPPPPVSLRPSHIIQITLCHSGVLPPPTALMIPFHLAPTPTLLALSPFNGKYGFLNNVRPDVLGTAHASCPLPLMNFVALETQRSDLPQRRSAPDSAGISGIRA